MNYLKIYNQIIERAKHRILEGYSEKHHIIPRCMGGDNKKSNIVRLTAREHYICHWLLAEHYKLGKLWLALHMMASINGKQDRYLPSSRIIEYAKIKMSEEKRKFRHTDETRAKISLNHGKGTLGVSMSKETKEKISKANKGKKKTVEQIEKTIKHLRGKKRIITWVPKQKKIVVRLNDDGKIIEQFESVTAAMAKYKGVSNSLYQATNKTKEGFIFKFKEQCV
jgi:hypothetical protein